MKRRKGLFRSWSTGFFLKYICIFGTFFTLIQALHSPIDITAKPEDSVVPVATSINFFCRATGHPVPRIIWKKDGREISDIRYKTKMLKNNLNTLRIEHLSTGDTGIVTCYAYNELGEYAEADAKLQVLSEERLPPGFPSIKSHPQLRTFEKGMTARVSCNIDGDPPPKVMWLRDQQRLDVRADKRYSVSKTGGALMIQNASDSDQGEYECAARNSLGVRHSKSARIYVKVRQVLPYFGGQLQSEYKVERGGSINLTCIAFGVPLPRVYWKKTGGQPLMNPKTAPFAKNVLELSGVTETENYTCVAISNLGDIGANTTVQVRDLPPAPKDLQLSSVRASSVTLSWKHVTVEKNQEPVSGYIISYKRKEPLLNDGSTVFTQYEEAGVYREKEVPVSLTKYTVDGLHPYQEYEFFVVANSSIGRGPPSLVREVQTQEAPPSSPPRKIEARPLNKNSVIIHWEPPKKPNGKITGYKIFYTNLNKSTPFTVWNQRHTDKHTETLYNLETNRTYYILIQPLNSKGPGPLSQMVTVITRHGLPGQPMELTAKPLDGGRIQLKWEKPIYTLGIIGYSIRYNTTEKDYPEITLTAPTENFIVTGLKPNTYYSFRVAARTGPGLGAYCEYVSVRTNPSVPKGAPKINGLKPISSRSLLVEWEAPSEKDRNGALKTYLIRWRPVTEELVPAPNSSYYGDDEDTESSVPETNSNSSTSWLQTEKIADNDTTTVISGLMPFTLYEVTLTASTEIGYGPESEPRRERTLANDPNRPKRPVPSQPKNVQVDIRNATTVLVTWEKPDAWNGDPVKGYYVDVFGEKANRVVVLSEEQKCSTTLQSLEPRKQYEVRVAAFNVHGDGEVSAARKFETPGMPPSEPQVYGISFLNERPFQKPYRGRITWGAPKATYGLLVKHYIVWYKSDIDVTYHQKKVEKNTASSTLTLEVDDLSLGRVYDFVIAAVTDDGIGLNATEQLSTPEGIPSKEPLNLRYTLNNHVMTVLWDPPPSDSRNGKIERYEVHLTPVKPEGERIEKKVAGDARSFTYNVKTRQVYNFSVAAATREGLGPFAHVLNIDPDPNVWNRPLVGTMKYNEEVATVDSLSSVDYFNEIIKAGVPGPLEFSSKFSRFNELPQDNGVNISSVSMVETPTSVSVQAMSNTSVVVQWDYSGQNVSEFEVHYMHEPPTGQGRGEKWLTKRIGDPAARHLHISELLPDTRYAFCVTAVRNGRQGSCSDPPVSIDKLEPTHVVSNLHVEYKTDKSVALAWNYEGPHPVMFYVRYSGFKEYFDINGNFTRNSVVPVIKDVTAPDNKYLVTELRQDMEYVIQLGVKEGNRTYFPSETKVKTKCAASPMVMPPRFVGSKESTTATLILGLASEEYGPISHYWLIVVPGNFTSDRLSNVESNNLRVASAYEESYHPAPLRPIVHKKGKRAHRHKRHYAYQSDIPGVYVAANFSATDVRKKKINNETFTLGDGGRYGGFLNRELEANTPYRVLMRAFTRELEEDRVFVPSQHSKAKLESDSVLSPPFFTRSSLPIRGEGKTSSLYIVASLAAVLLVTLLFLLLWWQRCNRKGSSHSSNRHASITKVAIGNSIPSETSKLLSSEAYGRQVMNPYERANGGNGFITEPAMDMYPVHQSVNFTVVPNSTSMLPSSGGPLGGHSLTHPPIPITELAAHIEKLKMNNNAMFSQEYESIETGQLLKWENSALLANKSKNRYANVVAYDHSRVELSVMNDDPTTDYINANYIDGYERIKAYIATQGPLPETFSDFWRMVWEQDSVTIVMLTRLEESSRVKCDQYWPSRGTSTYGNISVSLADTLELAHYTIRTFQLQYRNTNELREVRHLQYTAWPDHGVPDKPTPFLMFLKRVKTLNPPNAGPVVTHCSAGIGRTGAFIAIDCMLERLRYENTIDIFGCVTALRSQRQYMVQTDDQYIFIHDAVLDAAQSGSTEVPVNKLYTHMQVLLQIQPIDQISGMELEFRHLATLKMANSRCAVANLPANRSKNRLVNMVPYDSARVVLEEIPGVDGSDYINASWIDGYRQRNAYIATQGPLPQTVNDFWRMIWEHESAIIVMLVKVRELGRDKCCEYWPVGSGAQFGHLVVEPIAEYNMTQYILREFRITETRCGQSRTVRHFQYADWPEQGVPNCTEQFVDFIHQVHHTKDQFGNLGPITVHCSTGTGRTGVFIALSIIIDRMKLEQVVDVFTTVKLLRSERQNMVQDKDQYHFCYQAALEFYAICDNPYQT